MRSIAFTSRRGAAHASAFPLSLGVAALQAGERVFIVEAHSEAAPDRCSTIDQLHSISVATAPAELSAMMTALERKGATLVIVNAPDCDDAAMAAIRRATAVCVNASDRNVYDLWALELFADEMNLSLGPTNEPKRDRSEAVVAADDRAPVAA
jgi:chromosome partitioning protein